MKLRYLDGLRGIAALVVVFNHLAFIFIPFAINGGGKPHGLGLALHNTPLYVLVDGDLAVCIFFVLSGVVLSARFFRTGDRNVVAASAVKRYFRLAIPVLASVMAAFVLIKLGWMYNYDVGTLMSPWWKGFWQFPAVLGDAVREGLWNAFTADHADYNPVLWTMRYEFFGSFLVFITITLFGKLRNRWIIYAILAAFLWRSYYLAFLLGVMISDYLHTHKTQELRTTLAKGYWVPVLGVSLLLGSYPITVIHGTLFENVWLLLGEGFTPVVAHVAAAFGILIAIISAPLLQQALQVRPVQFLGRISFPMYLLHFLILGSYTSYFFLSLSSQMSTKLAAMITLVPTLAITFAAAYLFARYIDEPAIAFSGWFFRRYFGPTR